MVGFGFPHQNGANRGHDRGNWFSYWFLQLDEGNLFPAIVHLQGSVFLLTNQSLALVRPVAPLAWLQLQISILVPDHPIVPNRPLGFQAENLTQFACRRAYARDNPPVAPPLAHSADCVGVNTPPPSTRSLPHSLQSLSAAFSSPTGPDASRGCVQLFHKRSGRCLAFWRKQIRGVQTRFRNSSNGWKLILSPARWEDSERDLVGCWERLGRSIP
jgi:hypothetical protein